MRKLILLIFMCCILISNVLAEVSWNVESGYWADGANWDAGRKPDNTDTYINIRYSATSVCTLNTAEGNFGARLIMQNGQTLNIEDGGSFGAKWSRLGRDTNSYINLSGNGSFTMNDDDLYIGVEGGYCEWIMSDTSSLITQGDDGDDGEEFHVASQASTSLLQLNGSGVTINVDRIHFTSTWGSGGAATATLEFVPDAGGVSTIVVQRNYIAENGVANLLLTDPGVTLAEQDMVLIEATSGYDIGGNGVFDTLNGGSAAEGTLIVLGKNVYALTYTYDANSDGENNDVALVFVRSAKHMASNPVPADRSSLESSPLTLSWTNPDPNDGISPITCTVHFGIAPPDPNWTNMDSKTLPPDVSSVDINTENFKTYGVQPLADANDFYWVVDCFDPSAAPGTGQGLYWKFSTDYNMAPLVDAGPDQVVWLGMSGTPGQEVVNLDGTTSDDGQPGPEYDVLWTQTGGTEVDIIPADQDDTSVTITEAGIYVFKLIADDSSKQAEDTVQIIVGENACDASYLNGSDFNLADLDQNCIVDLNDFATLVADWLECTDTLTNCGND